MTHKHTRRSPCCDDEARRYLRSLGERVVSEAELAAALPLAFPAVTVDHPTAMAAAIFAALSGAASSQRQDQE